MKTLPRILTGVALIAAVLSCREAEALTEKDEVNDSSSTILFSREAEDKDPRKDPPKDPPKDRDNWRTKTGRSWK